MITSWTICCCRNVVIFDGAAISLSRWKEAFKDEFKLNLSRAKPSAKILLSNWLSSFYCSCFFYFRPTALYLVNISLN
jgi:hypothetical protein